MKTLDAKGQALNKDMPSEAIVGTGQKPTIAVLPPSQELAAVMIHVDAEIHLNKPTRAAYQEMHHKFFGMDWITDYKIPVDEIQFRTADGEIVAKIINLKIPEIISGRI